MALGQRSELGIGRGDAAESHVEAPMFAFFMVFCAIGLFIVHITLQNTSLTIALTVSLLVFGITVVRVEYGLYILLAAMLLSPEIQAGSVGANDERGVNLRYDDVLIIIIFLGVLVKHAFEGRPLFWRATPINPGIFAYYTICVISTLLALRLSVPAWDRDVAFFVLLKMLEFYLIFFMVGVSVVSVKEIRHLLVVFFVVSLFVCAYGIFSIGTLPRVSAPFEAGGTEPNTLGGYLMIVMCVGICLALYTPSSTWRMTTLAVSAIAFIPFVMTLSRTSYLSFFIALTLIGVLSRRTWILMLIVAVLIASPILMPDQVKKRIESTFEPTGVAVQVPGMAEEIVIDKSAYERVYVWEKVRYNLTIWPWFGGGISWDTVLDSQYARVLIETGLLGFAAFLFLLWRILKTNYQAFNWSRFWVGKGLALGMLVSTVGLLVHGFGTISFLIVRIMEPFWFLIALTCVAREIALLDNARRLKARKEQIIQAATSDKPRPVPEGPIGQTA